MDSKEGVEALFLFATEGILIVDSEGKITEANPSAERLFAYDSGELIGQKIEILVPHRFVGSHHASREKFTHNPHARSMGVGMDLYGMKKNGIEFPVEISLSPFSNAKGRYVIAFIIDISRRKNAEEKLKNYSAELEKQVRNRTMILEEAIQELEKTKSELYNALEKEKELNELKSRFVSMASHEFRTPLATILSSLSLVKQYGDLDEKEKQLKHINRIKTSINDLTDILNDFLSVSKLEEGRIECHLEYFDIQNYIPETLKELQGICKEGQFIDYKHQGESLAYLDKKLLKNILLNLVSNAIKFSPNGKAIEVYTEVSPSKCILKVTDYGIGIPKQDQKHLFQRFFRGHNVNHIQGTGLGLNIISKYAELLKGSVTFKSVENQGTTFTITFPQ
ncbi:MAG: PAS domain-containing sensor histidine kinase [Bacteroidia bacterium]|nr:PAS domain-containing sensor histidine kinase [Bacteroidia bacterium]